MIVGSTCWSCRLRYCISSKFPFFSSWLSGPFSSTCFSWESPSVAETSSCCPSLYSSEFSPRSGLDFRGSSIIDISGFGSLFCPVSSNTDGSFFVRSSFWSCRSRSCISSRCTIFCSSLNGSFSFTCFAWESPFVATSSCCPSLYSSELSSWSGLDFRGSSIIGSLGFGSLFCPVSCNTEGSLIVELSFKSCRSRYCISSICPFFFLWVNGPLSIPCLTW